MAPRLSGSPMSENVNTPRASLHRMTADLPLGTDPASVRRRVEALALPLLVSGAIVLVGTLLCVRHPAAALPHGG